MPRLISFRTALLLLAMVGIACPTPLFAQTVTATPAKAAPVYVPGEAVVWNLAVTGSGSEGVKEIKYSVKRDAGTVIASGTVPVVSGMARVESKLEQPGTLLVQFSPVLDAGATAKATLAGAVIEPDKILPSSTLPADFDEFWRGKIADLKQIPLNPQLTPEPADAEGVDYAKVTLDNIHGSKVQGEIARPTVGAKFPALLLLQYAGVYGLPKTNVTGYAKKGWLALDINAHDLPIDQTADFYTQQANGPLKNYVAIGAESRETSYFLRMILGCVRAIEYLKTRPDWNGQTLVAMGTSQGGMQSLAIGGLDPAVTAVIVNVAAGCDVTGPTLGRAVAWPYWTVTAHGNPAVLETSRYYDALNFARHIHVPTLMAVGLLDTTAPAAGDIAAFNTIAFPLKRLVIMEHSDHQGHGGTQTLYYRAQNQWLDALARGQQPSLAP